jgi:hypothetical protein
MMHKNAASGRFCTPPPEDLGIPHTKVFIPVRISMGMSSMSMTMPSTAINKVSTHSNC